MRMDRIPSRAARKAHQARSRRTNNWMPRFAAYSAAINQPKQTLNVGPESALALGAALSSAMMVIARMCGGRRVRLQGRVKK